VRIVGIGTDIVEIERIARAVARHGEAFGRRILSGREFERWESLQRSPSYLAKRFATKEAAAKALGSGVADGVRWCDIETVHDAAGKPELRLHGVAAALAAEAGVGDAQVGVSDERAYAVAFVILVADVR